MTPPTIARRSPRVLQRVPIRIEQEQTSCAAHTAVVNGHGAMILAPVRFPDGSQVVVHNVETEETAGFRVAWCGGEDLPGLYKLGIELLDERSSFWGPEYDDVLLRPDA